MAEALGDVRSTLQGVEASAERLQAVLGDDLVASLKDIKQLTPTEQAQVHTALMQVALTATAFLHRAQGNAGPPAALTAEHRQLKAYETRLQKVLANEDLKAQRKKMEINIDAAHRFIEHAIPELTRQQKTSLKQVAQDHKDKDASGLGKPSRLAAEKKRPMTVGKGLSATERLRQGSAPRKAARRDAVEALLDDL